MKGKEKKNKIVEEDFSWAFANGEEELINLYLKYPLDEWKTTVKNYENMNKKEGPGYQECARAVLEREVFKG